MKTVAVIIGTRPEAIKLLPVYKELQRSAELKPFLISTGQHAAMVENIWDLFDAVPDFRLLIERKTGSLSDLTGQLFLELGGLLEEKCFDAIMVQGDTTTAFVGALTGFYARSLVIHVEAGLRTWNLQQPFPEEANRQMISRVTDIHFVPGQSGSDNLEKEGLTGDVQVIGNTVVDALLMIKNRIEHNADKYEEQFAYALDGFEYIALITGHRRENLGTGIVDICNAIKQLAKTYGNCSFIFPTHFNPEVYNVVRNYLSDIHNVFLIDPLPYDQMVFLMMRANIIISDSGGIQEEAPSFGVPVLVTRESTERTEGLDRQISWLTGTDTQLIKDKFQQIIADQSIKHKILSTTNPYGDGKASERIRVYLENKLV